MSYGYYDKDSSDIKTLSTCWYVYAAILIIPVVTSAIFLMVWCGVFGLIGAGVASRAGAIGGVFMLGPLFALMVGGLGLLVSGVIITLYFMTGKKLARYESEQFCSVVAVIACLNVPLGTLLGVFTLMVLARPGVKQRFAAARSAGYSSAPPYGGSSSYASSTAYAGGASFTPDYANAGGGGYQNASFPTGGYSSGGYAPAPSKPAAGGGKGWLIGGIAGGAFLLLALVCGIGGWFMLSSGSDTRPVASSNLPAERPDARPSSFPRSPIQFPTGPTGQVAPSFGGAITSVDQAVGQLGDSSSSARRSAAEWLAATTVEPAKRQAVTTALAAVMNDSSFSVSGAALEAMIVWGDASNTGSVRTALEKRRGNSVKAIEFLGRFPEPSSAAVIAPYLSSSGDTADAAEAALEKIGAGAKDALIKELQSRNSATVARATRILEKSGVDMRDTLLTIKLEQLQSDNHFAAKAAGAWLAGQEVYAPRQADVARALETAASGNDHFVKQEAMKALAVWADAQSGSFLVARLRANPREAEDSIVILGNLKYESAAEEIAKHLDSGAGEAAATALAAIGPKAAPAVLPYFNDSRNRARDRARQLLSGFNTPQNLLGGQCLADLKNPNGKSITALVEWLKSVTLTPDQNKLLGEQFVVLANNPDRNLSGPALLALVEMQDDRVLPALGNYLGSPSTQGWSRGLMRNTGDSGEAMMIKLLQKGNAEAVTGACYVLADIGTSRSLPAIQGVMRKAGRFTGPATAANNALLSIQRRGK